MNPLRNIASAVLLLAAGSLSHAETLTPDLTGSPSEKGWKLINRSAALIENDKTDAIRLEGDGGTGFVRLENVVFGNGVIELDIRGRDIAQQSFVGLAFHGAEGRVDTYDAVYFRPFNFRADDPARRARAVQYISHPVHTWQELRSKQPGKYEKPIMPVPSPDAWFHVRIEVRSPKVSVFVEGAAEPCLVVEQLSDRKSGWIALWTDVKGGDFANLVISPAQ